MLLFSSQRLFLPSADFFFPSPSRCSLASAVISSRAAALNNVLSRRSSSIGGGGISAAVTDSSSPAEGGPIELPPSDVQSSPLQSAASLLLTGAIAVFLFRSLRRRAKRVTETRFTSSGERKPLKEEALESLKKSVTLSPPPSKSPPTAIQALIGALAAAVIALILYRFTTTIESALSRQTISDNYSVRQITVTIRTIINGLCYLATFVFGANSVGLLLYSGQLAFNSFNSEEPPFSTEEKSNDALSSESEDQSSENTQ